MKNAKSAAAAYVTNALLKESFASGTMTTTPAVKAAPKDNAGKNSPKTSNNEPIAAHIADRAIAFEGFIIYSYNNS